MKRIFHKIDKWEDLKAGMYNHISLQKSDNKINKCIDLLTDDKEFYSVMKDLCIVWKCSAESNLSNSNNNRRAWLGRASCCYKLNYPENITQAAWIKMSPKQRENANKTADLFLKYWDIAQMGQKTLWE